MPLFSEPPEERAEPSPTDRPWSVGELAGQIKAALVESLPRKIRVVGEVSNLSDRNHWFFSLKDQEAAIRAVMFASAARRVGFPMRDGIEVVATGRIDFYDAQGSVQLYVDKLEPVGEGARELALRALMNELREAGYFAPEHKKPLPGVPRKIAVVTSRSAAALQDVIDTAGRRWGGCELVLVDVRVQGEEAAPQIARALRRLSAVGNQEGIEAVILTRGGGSIEDLWAFNQRVVADAVFECALPVVAAIGHETDTTVAELVADLRCATPTQAAMTLVPDHAVLQEQVQQLQRRLKLSLSRRLESGRLRLEAAVRHPLFQRPGRLVQDAGQNLDRLSGRLHSAQARRVGDAGGRVERLAHQLDQTLPRRLNEARSRLESLSRTLGAVSPQNVLERGYSVTLGPDGQALKRSADASPGTSITTLLADGRVKSIVGGGPPKPPRKLKPLTDPDGGPTLFA